MIAFAAALFLLPHSATPTEPAPIILPDAPSASISKQSSQSSTQAPSPAAPASPPPAPQWRNVESLQPDDPIAVLETGRQYPTPCSFDDTTDESLTCIVYAPYSVSRRIVYPIHSIAAVYIEEQTFQPPASHVLIAAAIGGTLGGLVCGNFGPGGIAIGTVFGAGAGALMVLSPPPTPFPRAQGSSITSSTRHPEQYHHHMASLTTNPARDLESLLHEAEIAHGHLCAGQILGVRLALLALRRLGIEDPRSRTLPDGTLNPDRKRLVTFVEIDRCATDAIAVVTACRLGKRALKFRDWGKMAATLVDLASPIPDQSNGESNASVSVSEIGPDFSPDTQTSTQKRSFSPRDTFGPETPTYKAIRIAALESSKQRARDLYPHIENKNEQQMLAYRELPDADLFSEQWVAVPLHPREMPGYKSPRIACALCGEGINYDRESIINNQTLCQSCAHPESRYYHPLK